MLNLFIGHMLTSTIGYIMCAYLLFMACLALLVSAFARLTHHRHVYYVTQFALLSAVALFIYFKWMIVPYIPNAADMNFVIVTSALVCLGAWVILVYSKPYIIKHHMHLNEFSTLMLFAVLGINLLVSAQNLLIIYLGIELLALSSYVLVALRRENTWAIEAGLKYFILGAIASGMLLYGISMIFGVTHQLDINQITHVVMVHSLVKNPLLLVGLIMVAAATAFKLGLAPFQMWVPDVYQGSPVPVTMFIATIAKIAAFVMIIKLFYVALHYLSVTWSHVFIVLGILSLLVGNIGALRQGQIKRLLAYSSIAQMGYIILSFATATDKGVVYGFFYLIAYIIASLVAMGALTMLSKDGEEIVDIKSLSGLSNRYPWLAFMLLMAFFSMAGIPPFIGFIAKLTIIEALISAHLTWVAVVMILFAIVAAFYYLKLIRVMYFDKQDHALELSRGGKVTLSINALLILILGIMPNLFFYLF